MNGRIEQHDTLGLRVSPLTAAVSALQPVWGEVHGMRMPLRFGEGEEEQFGPLALADMSCMPKLTLKGPMAGTWLSERRTAGGPGGRVVPFMPVGRFGCIARTGTHEFFLEADDRQAWFSLLSRDLRQSPAGVYRQERQDAEILLAGEKSRAVMARTCAHSFHGDPPGIILTRVAGISCAVLFVPSGSAPLYRVWCEPSYGVYLWEELLAIVRELGGAPVGIESLLSSRLNFNGGGDEDSSRS